MRFKANEKRKMNDTSFKITFRFAIPDDAKYFYNLLLKEKNKISKQLGIYGFDNSEFNVDNYKCAFVALANDEPVGFAKVSGGDCRGFNYIGLFYVIQNYRKKGIGTQLFKFVETYAFNNWNAKGIELYTLDNVPMEKLTKKMGFSLTGIYKKNTYINGKYYNQSRWVKLYK